MIREAIGKTQWELAEVLGVKQSFLSAVERGARKAPASWELVLKQEYGVSNVFFQFGSITKEDKWYYAPLKRTPKRTPRVKSTSSSTTKTGKSTTKAPDSKEENRQFNLLKADSIHNTVEAAAVGGEAARRWAARRVTESKIYKRYPAAKSETLTDYMLFASLGQYTDNLLDELRKAAQHQVDKVLDQTIDGELALAQAAEKIQEATKPINSLQSKIEGFENAMFGLVAAAVEQYPELLTFVKGTPLHFSLEEWQETNETGSETTN